MNWRVLLFAAAAVSIASCGGLEASPGIAPAAVASDSAWLQVSDDRRALTIVEGMTVEVEGSGRLEFVDGRRTIRVPANAVSVGSDGQPVRAGPYAGSELRIVDALGTSAWMLHPVDEIPSGPGTRIRDPAGGEASVSSETELRFFLRVQADGTTVFFHPDPSPTADQGLGTAARISRMLERYAGYGFSGVVAVDVSGRARPVIEAAGRRRSGGTGPPMDPATIFELGSLTKQLTAAALLELEDRGLLSTEDALARWRPELPSEIAEITLHQLLIHVSGLPEDVDVPADNADAVWRTLADVELEFAPGDGWSYSNLGYIVLAAVIDESAPCGYRALVNELVQRAGVEDLGFPERHPEWEPRYATGGSGPLGTGRITERRRIERSGWDRRLGASGAVATIPTLYDWFRALQGGRVLSPAATVRMFEERPPEIAYGWFYLRSDEALLWIAHGGDTQGFQTYLAYEPATDRAIALGINDRRGWRGPLLQALKTIMDADTLPELPPPVATQVDGIFNLGGRYEPRGGGSLRVKVMNGRLRLTSVGEVAIAMLTGADRQLVDSLARITRRTERFLSLLIQGDSASIEAELSSSGRSDSFWRIWSHLTSGHPDSPSAYHVLGTIPDRAGRLVSFTRLEFADGDETLRLVWRPHLDGWGTGGDLPSRDFWPVGDGRFVSFDPTRQGWVELRFEDSASIPTLVDRAGRRAPRVDAN